jgi:hypothetical protein
MVFKVNVGDLSNSDKEECIRKMLKNYNQEWNGELLQNELLLSNLDLSLLSDPTKQDATGKEQLNKLSDGEQSTSEVLVCKVRLTPSPRKTKASRLFYWLKSKLTWKNL